MLAVLIFLGLHAPVILIAGTRPVYRLWLSHRSEGQNDLSPWTVLINVEFHLAMAFPSGIGADHKPAFGQIKLHNSVSVCHECDLGERCRAAQNRDEGALHGRPIFVHDLETDRLFLTHPPLLAGSSASIQAAIWEERR